MFDAQSTQLKRKEVFFMETLSVLQFYHASPDNRKQLIAEIIGRAKLFDGKFNIETFFNRKISKDFENTVLQFNIPDSANVDFKEKFKIIFTVGIGLDFDDPTKNLGYLHGQILRSLSNETLKTLLLDEFFNEFSVCDLCQILSFLICGNLSQEILPDFLETYFSLSKAERVKIIKKISNLKIRKIDRDVIDLISFKIPLGYLSKYKRLGKKYRHEFWNWIELRENNMISNPVKLFFERKEILSATKFNNKQQATLFHLKKERRRLFLINSTKIEDLDKIKFRDYIEEAEKIESAIDYFSRINFRRAKGGKSDLHHIFFPRKIYNEDIQLKTFRENRNNQIRILKKAHRKMNVSIEKFINRNGLPILTRQMIELIKTYRVYYDDEYLNFLELQRVFAEICIDTRPNLLQKRQKQASKVFILASQFYELLKIQARYIKPVNLR